MKAELETQPLRAQEKVPESAFLSFVVPRLSVLIPSLLYAFFSGATLLFFFAHCSCFFFQFTDLSLIWYHHSSQRLQTHVGVWTSFPSLGFTPRARKGMACLLAVLFPPHTGPQPQDEREGCASCFCFLCGPGPHSASSSSLQAPDGRRHILSAPWRPVCFMTKSMAHAPIRS